jgi:hypothetical protein
MAELARLEDLKKRLAELVGAGELDLNEYREARVAHELRAQELRRVVARSSEQKAQRRAREDAIDLREKWDELGIEERRRVAKALAARIEVGPAIKGRNF